MASGGARHVGSLDELQLDGSALTIGSFDGVHRGHQALIGALVQGAQGAGVPAVVLTFYPHPSVVLRGRKPSFYIDTPEEKAARLAALGVDHVVTQPFDADLAAVSAEAFLDRLQARLGFRQLWVGEDFALGHRRRGNVPFLEREAGRRGFQLHVHPPVLVDGEVVSSTRVREALRSGDVARAARYLGRAFTIPGRVVRGAGRGRSLGIPTANLAIWDERAVPGAGVYACLAAVGAAERPAVTNIGVRPTFEGQTAMPVVEAHLLDFDGEIYDQELRLAFVERLRDERRFDGPQALLAQIERDILRARVILNTRGEGMDA